MWGVRVVMGRGCESQPVGLAGCTVNWLETDTGCGEAQASTAPHQNERQTIFTG